MLRFIVKNSVYSYAVFFIAVFIFGLPKPASAETWQDNVHPDALLKDLKGVVIVSYVLNPPGQGVGNEDEEGESLLVHTCGSGTLCKAHQRTTAKDRQSLHRVSITMDTRDFQAQPLYTVSTISFNMRQKVERYPFEEFFTIVHKSHGVFPNPIRPMLGHTWDTQCQIKGFQCVPEAPTQFEGVTVTIVIDPGYIREYPDFMEEVTGIAKEVALQYLDEKTIAKKRD